MDNWKEAIQKLQADLLKGDPATTAAFIESLEQFVRDGFHAHDTEAQEINPALKNLDVNMELRLYEKSQSFLRLSATVEAELPLSDSLVFALRYMRMQEELNNRLAKGI